MQLHRVNSHVEILVTDTGEGIAPEVLPFIFERFRQGGTGSTREYGGLGLGLTIARHLTELHGGTIIAHSEGLGKGAQFTVKLPVMAAVATTRIAGEERNHPSAQQNLHGDTPVSGRAEILVVDDEPMRARWCRLFSAARARKYSRSKAQPRALEPIAQWHPDLLVSDIGMPQEDGYTLLRKLRALPPEQGGRIPAIALTAFARTQDRLNILSAGYQMHVPKPIEQLELLTVVASLTKRL